MNAVPRRFLSSDDLRVYPLSDPTKGLWLDCSVTHPPSMEGRIVSLYLDGDAVTRLLMELRRVAIAARSTPMEEA